VQNKDVETASLLEGEHQFMFFAKTQNIKQNKLDFHGF
jgi:hypothetical protein